MFSSWFGPRASRSSTKERFFRPRLECLEGRLAPSSLPISNAAALGGGGGGSGGNPLSGPTEGGGGNQLSGPNEGSLVGPFNLNGFDNFDTTINDSPSLALNTLMVNHAFATSGLPQNQLQSAFNTTFFLSFQTNPQAAISLLADEAVLAMNTIRVLPAALIHSPVDQALLQNIHALQSSIQRNPLETTLFGQVAGVLAYDLVLRTALPAQQGARIAIGQGVAGAGAPQLGGFQPGSFVPRLPEQGLSSNASI